MSEEFDSMSEKLSFWKSHVEKAQEFKGSDRFYCDQNNLKLGTFGWYKKKFGYAKQSSSASNRL